jgi:hypothetical protein
MVLGFLDRLFLKALAAKERIDSKEPRVVVSPHVRPLGGAKKDKRVIAD